MITMTVRTLSGRTITANFKNFAARTIAAGANQIHKEAETILAVSQNLVPVDTGLLQSSGTVEGPFLRGQRAVVVQIIYGGIMIDYATDQHENLDYHHERGRQAHFLSEPFSIAEVGMATRVAAGMKRDLAVGTGKVISAF